MIKKGVIFSISFLFLLVIFENEFLWAEKTGSVKAWISSEDGKYKLSDVKVKGVKKFSKKAFVIEVDKNQKFQSILGMGGSLEHATCWNLMKLSPEDREEVIERLVHPEKGIGMNLMRICIGTSDFVGEPYYTYSDLPPGQTDFELKNFSIEKDKDYVIPILKMAKEKNPEMLFFASPWSPPAWMKDSQNLCGGKLKRECYSVYAEYLKRFIEAYKAESIPVYAITVQNEPLMEDPDYPTCVWNAEEQKIFIRDYLGPLFEKNNIETKIWCWDHNWNVLDFPRAIFSDPGASRYVDGTGFHLYEGKVEAQTVIHNEFPHKHIYFTEGSTFYTRGAVKIIEIFRNWARSYNLWVICLDWQRKPNRGPHHASATMIVLTPENKIEYRYDYYMYGQFMKFVKRGAYRIFSTPGDRYFNNVAFLNPDGKLVLIVANAENNSKLIGVNSEVISFEYEIPPKSVITFVW